MLNREIVLEKLKAFLENKLPQDDLYEWALSQVCKSDYEATVKDDIVLKEALQAMIDINRSEVQYIPTREDLDYYRRCLSGKQKYQPLELRRKSGDAKSIKSEQAKFKDDLFLGLRIYVLLFAFCSLVVNIFAIFRPELLKFQIENPTTIEAIGVVFPHILYSAFLLTPLRYLTRKRWYYLALTVFCLGSIYYWSITISIVLKLSLNILLIFVFAPFTGIPTLFAILLLLDEKAKDESLLKSKIQDVSEKVKSVFIS